MAQREWVEKDFYKELGVASDASQDEIKRAARKILAENHPDRNPGNSVAEERYKAASEAKEVLTDPAKRKEYDETRRLFAGGGFGRGRFSGGGGGFGGFGGGDGQEFNLNDLFDAAGQTGGANIGDLFGGLFGRGGAQPRPSRPRRGNDLETETELSFLEATKGVAMPLRLTSPAPCTNCHGSGARPGTSPKVCPTCNGAGVVNRNQGARGVLRTVYRMPRQRVDHRASVRRMPWHRRDHPYPHHQRADPAGRRGRSAHSAGRSGRGRAARRAVR